MVGKTVQQYQILEKLGAGGMGDIYKAQDSRLGRFVAIKVLTSASAGDPERRRRFVQEAQAASALNHPNIITIHDIISEGDADYMVMEYVQGKTLGEVIPRGGLRVPQVLKMGLQMTDALSAAHSAGIIHRDLKPGNVMVTASGLVKVLDFGLAKLTDSGPITQTGPDDATMTIAERPLTVEGSIIGTVAYMSPEQAEGRKVDSRSDVFSMGVVLYEMVTGERAFQGDSALSTLSSILRDDPKPILEIAPDVPQPLEHLVWRCLRKSPDERFQTMRDVHAAMSGLKHESDSGILYRTNLMASMTAANPAGKAAPSSITNSLPPSGTQPVSEQQMPAVSTIRERRPPSTVRTLVGGAIAIVAITGGLFRSRWSHSDPAPPPPAAVAPAEPVAQVLTNDSIVKMWLAKVPLATIFNQMRSDKTAFNLSADEVIRLTSLHIPGQVIEAMRDPKNIPILPAPADPASAAATAKDAALDPTKAGSTTDPAAKGAVTGGRQVALLNGTPFTIALAADIPDNAEQGNPLRFTVTTDVRVGDSVVIAKGATVTGEIAQGAKKRLFGGARMTLRLLTVDAVDGRKYSVRAVPARSSDGKAERRVETNVKPTTANTVSGAGAEYLAYADGDLLISVKK